MKASSRIIVNTIAQYARSIINMVLTLYSSRLVLSILGQEDYGVYSLVAGVVSLLSFLTNSLVGSTQRFLSVSQGLGNIDRLKEVFNNSLILHIAIGFIISLFLGILTNFIFDGFLNIPDGRIAIAKMLYLIVVVMVYISFITSPYRALLVSHENIVYVSAIDVLDGILKVILVLFLPLIDSDKLLAYGCVLLAIQLFNLFAFMIYSHCRYEECILPRFKLFSITYLKELSHFTGWILYSSICISFRVQGLAIVLNKVFGSVINAAYGIGSQISGMISFISSSFTNAIAPQLMAAEGRGDRKRMLLLAEIQSKISFLLLSMIGIPVMFEMQELLEIWLVDVPDHTMVFSCMFLSMQIIDMLSSGLGNANRAIGNIGFYTLVTYTPKLIVLPISWFLLKNGNDLGSIVVLMVFIETLCMLLRIFLLRKESWFNLKEYMCSVIVRSLPPVCMSIIVCLLIHTTLDINMRFIISFLCSVPLFVIVSYFWALNKSERSVVISLVNKILSKI